MGRTSTVPRKVASGASKKKSASAGKPMPKMTPDDRRHIQEYFVQPKQCAAVNHPGYFTTASTSNRGGVQMDVSEDDLLTRALADLGDLPSLVLSPISDDDEDDVFQTKPPPASVKMATKKGSRSSSGTEKKRADKGKTSELYQLLQQPRTTTATPQAAPNAAAPAPVEAPSAAIVEAPARVEAAAPMEAEAPVAAPALVAAAHTEDEDDWFQSSQPGESDMVKSFLRYWDKHNRREDATEREIQDLDDRIAGEREKVRVWQDEMRVLQDKVRVTLDKIGQWELKRDNKVRQKNVSGNVLKRLTERMKVRRANE